MADTGQSNGETEDGKPKLAVVLRVKEVILRKKNEWGFVLRGTTTQYGSSLKIYTCKIDKVNQGGPADVSICNHVLPVFVCCFSLLGIHRCSYFILIRLCCAIEKNVNNR